VLRVESGEWSYLRSTPHSTLQAESLHNTPGLASMTRKAPKNKTFFKN